MSFAARILNMRQQQQESQSQALKRLIEVARSADLSTSQLAELVTVLEGTGRSPEWFDTQLKRIQSAEVLVKQVKGHDPRRTFDQIQKLASRIPEIHRKARADELSVREEMHKLEVLQDTYTRAIEQRASIEKEIGIVIKL